MSDTLYTDVVLQMLTAFTSSDDNRPSNHLIASLSSEEAYFGDGFFPGIVYGCLVHMSMMVSVIAAALDISRDDALQRYAMTYNLNRETFEALPGLHPKFVSEVMKRIMGEIKEEGN